MATNSLPMPPARWTGSPTRREISLLLLSLTVFIISFNLNPSLRVVGLKPIQKLGLGSDLGFDRDGRRLGPYRDDLENLIFGDWEWEEGQVAGVKSNRPKGASDSPINERWRQGPAVHNELRKLGDERPTTKLIVHSPGYTVIDSLVVSNGSFYIITDEPGEWPASSTIGTPSPISISDPYPHDWRVVSTDQARQIFPPYIARLHGVTLMSLDDSKRQDSKTFLSLWRAYSSLDSSITQTGATRLLPPSRVVFPRIPVFTEPLIDPVDEITPRFRSFVGFHQHFLKSVFPSAGIMYAQDWQDLYETDMPFILERVVVSDREAAARGSTNSDRLPVWATPFITLNSTQNWLEPVRSTLSRNMRIPEDSKEVVVTYVTRQDETWGPSLRDDDHATLVQELQRLGRDTKCIINILPHTANWVELTTSILKSTVVLGVYGEHLSDSILMKPSSHSTVMEFWPAGTFTRDVELLASSVGLGYTAWWTDRKLSGSSLPPVQPPANARAFRQVVLIDARAVTQSIRDIVTAY